MRRNRTALYQILALIVLAINGVLYFFYFPGEAKRVENAIWENPWYGLYFTIFMAILIALIIAQSYELGRKKGIGELANELQISASDYYDDPAEKITVAEKHTMGNKRKVSEIEVRISDEKLVD